MVGRLAQAISPTGSVALSYDSYGQVSARVFTDTQSGLYVEKHAFHADGSPDTLDFFLFKTLASWHASASIIVLRGVRYFSLTSRE